MEAATAIRHEYASFVDGEILGNATRERELIEPATDAPLARVGVASAEDADRAVDAARRSLEGPWGRTPPTERARLLSSFADALAANQNELLELEARNVGKAISSVKAEFAGAVETLRYYASVVGSICGRSNPLGRSLLFYGLKEPVGVVAQIVPWNYPLLMTTWKLGPALAAGCSVVLKPASLTPLSAVRLAELADDVGFPAGVLNVVTGPASVGAHLVSHPNVDKVAFTGSTAAGIEVMRGAAQGVKRVTLELGGKSPNLVFADADLDSAVPSSAWSIFYAAGQSCEARSRILVESSIYDEFVNRFVAATGRIRMGDPLDPKTQVGSLISREHRDSVDRYVQTGTAEGAELLTGGTKGDIGAFYAPTVLAGVAPTMTVAQEEIFGPVVTVTPFEDETHAIAIANDVRYGLMATIWTADAARGHRVAALIKSGMVGVNMPYTAFPGIPFGGYKESGFGRELGIESLDLYLETKSVIVNTSAKPINPFKL